MRTPMMAVAANSWASLKVHIQVQDFGQALYYRIVSLSGDDVTTKALLLWFIAHDLTNKEIEGRFLSLPEIDQRTRWLSGLRAAFGLLVLCLGLTVFRAAEQKMLPGNAAPVAEISKPRLELPS